ncbi:DNA adenine methylase [Xanthomonas campestris pv. campestris]|uniref:DNA adenine methylase n=1 Tax=Xanthomonas campestris TaxID=339 RepID=UPI0032E3F9FE
MNAVLSEPLRQRADYTHKFNAKTGRHGWLRLTPAYSLKVVEEIIDNYDRDQLIFDPFCGTGTTALSAAYHGHRAATTDINPFLIWLATAKTRHYTDRAVASARAHASAIVSCVIRGELIPTTLAPPIHNIERWWSPQSVDFLLRLRTGIAQLPTDQTGTRDLLLVAFCRAIIERSNAAFNHQSMSFKEAGEHSHSLDEMCDAFLRDVEFVLSGALDNPMGSASVIHCDSRALPGAELKDVTSVITSPPYANRMSYIRELRPYMYWLGHLVNGRDAGELDWLAIGGTWGIATSRLKDWQRTDTCFRSESMDQAVAKIAHADNKNGPLLARYVAKYFDDMWEHFKTMTPLLAPNADLHYIVGNSTFYGTLVSTELLYAEMLEALGFRSVECRAIRKRNSKKELIEFDVVAKWHGR